MHELSIAMSIIEIAEFEQAQKARGRVLSVHVRIGQLSGVAKEALLSAWEMARECSEIQQARLVVEELPVRINCANCKQICDVHSPQMLCCERCGAPSAEVVQGKEMEVFAMEFDS